MCRASHSVQCSTQIFSLYLLQPHKQPEERVNVDNQEAGCIYLFDIYYVSNSVLGTEDSAWKKADKTLLLWNLHSNI